MSNLNELEVGMVFWPGGGRDTLAEIVSMGVRRGQMVLAGDVALTPEFTAQCKADLAAANFTVATCFAAYNGEDYADIPTVERTVGFIERLCRGAWRRQYSMPRRIRAARSR